MRGVAANLWKSGPLFSTGTPKEAKSVGQGHG